MYFLAFLYYCIIVLLLSMYTHTHTHTHTRYVPAPGFDAKGEAIIPQTTDQSSTSPIFGNSPKVKKTKCKDPNAPKRNLSAYLLYQNAMRDQFKSDNPGMTFGQLSSYTSYVSFSLRMILISFFLSNCCFNSLTFLP